MLFSANAPPLKENQSNATNASRFLKTKRYTYCSKSEYLITVKQNNSRKQAYTHAQDISVYWWCFAEACLVWPQASRDLGNDYHYHYLPPSLLYSIYRLRKAILSTTTTTSQTAEQRFVRTFSRWESRNGVGHIQDFTKQVPLVHRKDYSYSLAGRKSEQVLMDIRQKASYSELWINHF